MWCDECHVQPANVFIKKVVNQQVTEVKLCERCARHNEVAAPLLQGAPLQIQKLVEDLLTAHQAPLPMFPDDGEDKDAVCPRCGTTYDRLHETGRVGCAGCYEAFRATLDAVIQQIHHSAGHAGKVPSGSKKEPVADELQALQHALSDAVAAERYEEAARLRDKMRSLKSTGSGF